MSALPEIQIRATNQEEHARGEYYAQGDQGTRPGSVLEEIARRGAQQMLAQAMEAEVAEFVQRHADKVDENGHRKVVRNGHMPARELITGIGRVSDQATAGGRPPARRRRRWEIQQRDPAALPEAGAERGQPDTCAVPEGSVDGGLLEGVAGDPGRRSTGTEREQRGTAEGGAGTGV